MLQIMESILIFNTNISKELTASPIVFVACPATAVLFNPAAVELAGTPGKAGKSSWDIVNSLGSIAGCFTIPTEKISKCLYIEV